MGTTDSLRRQLGLTSATALIVGEVIGLGIFLTPSQMAVALRSPFWILVVWIVIGLMTLCGGLCYGELAARFPEAGGGYVYLREAFGRPTAFLYGWVSLVVIDPGITAALAVGMVAAAAPLVALPPAGQKAVAVGTITALAVVNCLGVRLGAGVLRALTITKLGLLAFIVVRGFGGGLGDWNNFVPFVAQREGAEALPMALAAGLVGAFFSFGGWWDVSKLAGEVRDPERTMPLALALGIASVTVVFILVSGVFQYLVPPQNVTTDTTFVAQAGVALFGENGAKVFAGIVVLVVLGSLCSILMSQPRVYFAMARDGLFLKALADVHPRTGTPLRAIALEAVLASALVLWGGDFDSILGLFLFMAVLLIAFSVAALFVLRRGPAPAGTLLWSGHPYTSAFYLVSSAALLVLMGMRNPIGAGVGVVAVTAGLLAYRFLPSSSADQPKPSDARIRGA
jgi:APA family basic amino acid/polyamine antiporter